MDNFGKTSHQSGWASATLDMDVPFSLVCIRSGLNYEWGYFWEVCVFDCVCDDGELDGYGVVMGLFEGLFREERITEYDERIWSRELFDPFLMPLCVFACVDVYKAFSSIYKLCLSYRSSLYYPAHLNQLCTDTQLEEDIHSLMSYHHSGLWLEINVVMRATSSRGIYGMKAVSKCSFELYSMHSFRKDATLYNIHTSPQHTQQIYSELRNWHLWF